MKSTTVLAYLLTTAVSAYWPLQIFHSVDFDATSVEFTKQGEATDPGYLFISPHVVGEPQATSPTIITDEGELIWRTPNDDGGFDPKNADGVPVGVNFHPQTYLGNDYLTFWEGDQVSGYGCGYGAVKFLDNTYTQQYNVCLADLDITQLSKKKNTNPCNLDFHESRMTSTNTLLATVRDVRPWDLSPYGGSVDGLILDSQFVEVDPATQEIIFRWSPADQIKMGQFDTMAVAAIVKPVPTDPNEPWDWFHMNSVTAVELPIGGYMVSARVPSCAIKIDSNGNIEWVIKGDHTAPDIAPYGGNFTLDDDAGFAYQHDIVAYPPTGLTTFSFSMFDNANRKPNTKAESSGLFIDVDFDPLVMTATLNRRLQAPNAPVVHHIGSTQSLDNNHVLVDFGDPPQLNEFDGDGNVIYQALVSARGGGSTYRAYKLPWVGMPTTNPDLVSTIYNNNKTTQIYMSWNGATEYAGWKIFAGQTADGLKVKKSVYRKGFETGAHLVKRYQYVQVQALAGDGSVMGTSAVVKGVVAGT